MAIRALKPGVHVHGMGEIDEVRKSLQPNPLHGLLVVPVRHEARHVRGRRFNGTMTPHAQGHGWNAGRGRFGGMPVTIQTVDVETSRVQFMTEIEWLDILGRQIGAAGGVQETQ
jgi:hypothetical protein